MSGECTHERFEAFVEVNRLRKGADLPITGFAADVHIFCKDCDEPFVFVGLPAGNAPDQPMTSIDGKELRAPIRPASAPDDFGLDFPGVHVRVL
jgi:hypothetical protein